MTLHLAEDRPPLPPADLMLRVILPFGTEDIEQARRGFDLEGLSHLGYFERALAAVGRSFEDFDRLLDFGCGCGRFVRHFGQMADRVEIHGTDIDAEMIEWLRANVPFGSYEVAPHEPPLPYPENHFDLVINHSVFSHLDERLQDLWLAELQRITRPGGLLLLTVEGQSSWNRTLEACERGGEDPERWRNELETRGTVFIPDDVFVGSSHPDFYHATVHAPWYVFEHWSRFFDIAAYIPDGSVSQDLIVLRRRDDNASGPRLIGRRLSPAESPQRALPAEPASPRGLIDTALVALQRLARGRRSVTSDADNRIAVPSSDSPEFDAQAITREIGMLRVGLYEQGRRISIIAAELRDEIEAAREVPEARKARGAAPPAA